MFNKIRRLWGGARSTDVNDLLAEASRLISAGRLKEAGRIFRAALKQAPTCVRAQIGAVRVHVLIGETVDAHARICDINELECSAEEAIEAAGLAIEVRRADLALGILDRTWRHHRGHSALAIFYTRFLGDRGDFGQAAELLAVALENEPNNLALHLARAELAERSHDFRRSLDIYDQVLLRSPEYPAGWLRKGICEYRLGDLHAAEQSLVQAARFDDTAVEAALHLAELRIARGNERMAIEALRSAQRRAPRNPAVLESLGLVVLNKNPAQAEKLFEEVLAIRPESARAYFGLGCLCERRGQDAEALDQFLMACHYDSKYADAHFKAGVHLSKAGEHTAAVQHYEEAIASRPDFLEARCNAGILLYRLDEHARAEAMLRTAHTQNPDHVPTLVNMGLVLRALGNIEEAHRIAERAVALAPKLAEAACLLGHTTQDQGRHADALRLFEKVLKAHPNHDDALWARLHLDLLLENYKRAWPIYERRYSRPDWTSRPMDLPRWRGHELGEGALLVLREQGIGDEILFASCIPDLLRHVPKIVLECDPRLEAIFTRSFPSVRVKGTENKQDTAWLQCFPDVVTQVWTGSLPGFYRNEATDFPSQTAFLRPDEHKVARWQRELSELGPGLKVGISWRGGQWKTRRALRSAPVAEWAPILGTPGVHFISTQYGDADDEFALLQGLAPGRVHVFPRALADYDEMAALVRALDLLISVQTAVVNLAGALGCATWVLVPVCPQWRYGATGNRLRWFPSVTTWRQKTLGAWSPIMHDVAANLGVLAATKSCAS